MKMKKLLISAAARLWVISSGSLNAPAKRVLALLFFCAALSLTACASEFDELIPNVGYDETELITGYSTFSALVDAVVNGDGADYEGILEKILALLFKDLKDGMAYTAAIIGFAMLSACIKGTELKLAKGCGEIVFLVCYCVIAAFLLGILKNAADIAHEAAEKILSFVKTSVPVYVGFASAMLPSAAGAGMKGIFLLMINAVSSFAGSFMLGALFNIGLLYIINHMSSEIHVLRLIELVRQVIFWALGFLLTVFAGMAGLSGINADVASHTGMKAVKYTVGNAVPVVGGFLADSSEMIFASAAVFKNAFGTAGIIVIFSLCLVPVIKLFALGILLKAAAGLTEPFCDKRISDCTADVGQTVIYIMICVILMSVMFIFALSVILLLGVGG